uniref:B30.2/SPRY domain-containing protein n=1 Tax=Sinocyclocheilus grahami TaxID=75366 RepID=A0A672P1S9_SINGR
NYMHDVLQRVKDQHKTSMKNKHESLFEGIKLQKNEALLNRIYTQLYIIEGESEGVNEEHEVLQMEKSYRTLQDTPVNCNDIFKPSSETECEKKDKIKTVLTKGIAGIGKTVSVQKFILDWAEGKANQDVDFVFVLSFRELNLIKDHQYSLHRLLLDFHPELQDLGSKIYDECKVVFIFDGLDESRISLMFSDSQTISDVPNISSVGLLISNLMKGDLLPSALIWITTRPAAANQIPSNYINRVTEIQGFNDPQKEEYFRKRISDKHQASRIISHIRRARSLHIMCHIPVFCWISATVLQNILKQDLSAEIPQTLTEMYIYFLLIQTNIRNQKYEETHPEKLLQSNREVIVKLAELAFNQLMKGNVMFYEEDLRESGIDVTDASVYSGICTEIFREESVIYHRKVYSFVHLSFQEFFAALYVFFCYLHKNSEVLKMFLSGKSRTQCEKVSLDVFLKGAVNKALKSKNGHLDLFIRFLHGISLESNQRLLQDALIHTENNPESIKKIIQNLKQGQKNNVNPERWMNLSHCLIEMKDNSVVKEMQAFLKSETKRKNLSLAQCSTLANMILMSEEVLDEFDLTKYTTKSKDEFSVFRLAGCNLTVQHHEIVTSALQISNSSLKELDLSNNVLQYSGVKQLCTGLKSPNCQLNVLRLAGCSLTHQSCEIVASALQSSSSSLRELDLSSNDLQDSGVKLLFAALQSPNYARDLTLDPNTANTRLILYEKKRKVKRVEEQQTYPDHPERFDVRPQVMCVESLTERCYWEAERSGSAKIAVTYKGIKKKGLSDDCWFGYNEKSWSLFCSGNRFIARHNNKKTEISAPSGSCKRIGVYVDVLAGTLSFYSVSDTLTHKLTHLHTFTHTFTEPLYAGFTVYSNSSVYLRKLFYDVR